MDLFHFDPKQLQQIEVVGVAPEAAWETSSLCERHSWLRSQQVGRGRCPTDCLSVRRCRVEPDLQTMSRSPLSGRGVHVGVTPTARSDRIYAAMARSA